jgi:hypothetical protein
MSYRTRQLDKKIREAGGKPEISYTRFFKQPPREKSVNEMLKAFTMRRQRQLMEALENAIVRSYALGSQRGPNVMKIPTHFKVKNPETAIGIDITKLKPWMVKEITQGGI